MQKLINQVFKIIGWLQIAISPLLISLFFCAFIYYFIPNRTGLWVCSIVIIIGLIIGTIWATKVSKTIGTSKMLEQLNHKPEFDHLPSNKT